MPRTMLVDARREELLALMHRTVRIYNMKGYRNTFDFSLHRLKANLAF